jgi:hypothetical protein
MGEDNPLLVLMVGDPTVVVLEMMDVIFPPSGVDSQMEKFCVCVTLFDICNMGALFFLSLSTIAKLTTLLLRQARRSCSSWERVLDSWAMSR